MTTLTLSTLPDDAAVRIQVNADRVVRSITRTDANGTAPVRVLPGILPFVPPATETRRNLVGNPRASSTAGYDYLVNAAAPTFAAASAGGPSGIPTFVRATATAAATYLELSYFGGAAGSALRPAVTAGKTYTMSGWVRFGVAGTVTPSLAWTADNGAGVGATVAGAAVSVPANTWTRISVSGTVPAGATGAKLLFRSTASVVAGTTADLTGTMLEEGAALGAYFDGTTVPADEAGVYKWSGSAGASPSTYSLYTAGTITIDDYEPAAGVVSYVPKGDLTAGAAKSITFVLSGPWLFCPVLPSYSVRLKQVTGYDAAVDAHSTILEGLGRRDPIVILREMGTRSGSLDLYAGTYAAALDVLEAAGTGEVLMLRQPEHAGMDMYCVIRRAQIVTLLTAGGDTVWGTRIDYVEVARPAGYRAGAVGWTFASVKTAAASFSDLPAIFDTFAKLRLNERIPS